MNISRKSTYKEIVKIKIFDPKNKSDYIVLDAKKNYFSIFETDLYEKNSRILQLVLSPQNHAFLFLLCLPLTIRIIAYQLNILIPQPNIFLELKSLRLLI